MSHRYLKDAIDIAKDPISYSGCTRIIVYTKVKKVLNYYTY